MTDDDLTPEDLAVIKAQDARFAEIDLGFAIAAELRDSATVKTLVSALRQDALDAVLDLAKVTPSDINAVTRCVARSLAYSLLREHLNKVLHSAKSNIDQIAHEDAMRADEGTE